MNSFNAIAQNIDKINLRKMAAILNTNGKSSVLTIISSEDLRSRDFFKCRVNGHGSHSRYLEQGIENGIGLFNANVNEIVKSEPCKY